MPDQTTASERSPKRRPLRIVLWMLAAGLGLLFFMNIFFPYHLALYLVFVDWPESARWLRSRVLYSRAAGVAVISSETVRARGIFRPSPCP